MTLKDIFNPQDLDEVLKKVNAFDISKGRSPLGTANPLETQTAPVMDAASYDNWLDNLLTGLEIPEAKAAPVQNPAFEAVMQKTFPNFTTQAFTDVFKNDFPSFKSYMQQGGLNPDKQQLLKMMGYSDENIKQFFPKAAETVAQFDISKGRTPIPEPAPKAEPAKPLDLSAVPFPTGQQETPPTGQTLGAAFTRETGIPPTIDINSPNLKELVWNPDAQSAQEEYKKMTGRTEDSPFAQFYTSPVGKLISLAAGQPGQDETPFGSAMATMPTVAAGIKPTGKVPIPKNIDAAAIKAREAAKPLPGQIPIMEEQGNYLYHGTKKSNLESIRSKGLESQTRARNDYGNARGEYADEAPMEELLYFERKPNQNWGGKGKNNVQLRVNEDMLPQGVDVSEDVLRPKEFYTSHGRNEPYTIPPEAIEYYDSKSKTWLPVIKPSSKEPLPGQIGMEQAAAQAKAVIPKAVTRKPYDAVVYRGESGLPPEDKLAMWGEGTYYSTDPHIAQAYKQEGKASTVTHKTIHLDNPFIADSNESVKNLVQLGDKYGKNLSPEWSAGITKELKDQGYDGIVVKARDAFNQHDEVIVFNKPKAAEVATNQGEQIAKSLGETPKKAPEPVVPEVKPPVAGAGQPPIKAPVSYTPEELQGLERLKFINEQKIKNTSGRVSQAEKTLAAKQNQDIEKLLAEQEALKPPVKPVQPNVIPNPKTINSIKEGTVFKTEPGTNAEINYQVINRNNDGSWNIKNLDNGLEKSVSEKDLRELSYSTFGLPSIPIKPQPLKPPPGSVPPTKPVSPGGQVPAPKPEFAANIRLSKYPEEVRPMIKEWADANPALVQEARRGVRSDAQVLADAKALVEDMGGNFNKLVKRWKPGQAWNSEEIRALRGVFEGKAAAAVEASKVAESGATADVLKSTLAIQEAAKFQEIVHGVTAEPGRALRQFRQEVFDAFKANDNRKMEEILKRLGGKAKQEEVAKALGTLDINDPNAVANFIRNINKPHFADYLTEIYYNSVLSGPKTHIVNTLSNTVNALGSSLERAVAAGVEFPLAKLQGRARARFFSEVPADTIGAVEGIKDGAKAWAYTMRHGRSLEQASKYEMGKAFTGKLGYTINFPSTNLEAADAFMHQVNYRAALKATATRMAKMEGYKGEAGIARVAELIQNPSKKLLDEAEKVAEYRLFRAEPGKFTQAIMGLRDIVSIGGVKPLKFIVPFIRTPANLLKYGLERSPLGWMNPNLWKNVIAKNPEAADQIGRAVLGSMGATAIAWYSHEGRITGAAPTNPAERDRFYRDGKQPFSIRVGDSWVSYQRIEPFNQTFAQVSAAVDALKNKDKDAEQIVSKAIATIAQNLVSQTYMSGLSTAIDMIAQPERYAGSVLSRVGQALIVPASSALRTLAQMMDTTVRQPENFGQQLETGIPGLSQNVPAKLDVMGEEITRKSPAFSPINITPVQETALTKELDRLKINIGFAGKTIAGVDLTPAQQRQYQIESGNLIKQRISDFINSPSYPALSDKDKEKRINQEIFRARDEARRSITGEEPKEPKATFTLSPELKKAVADFELTQKRFGNKSPQALLKLIDMQENEPDLYNYIAGKEKIEPIPYTREFLEKAAKFTSNDKAYNDMEAANRKDYLDDHPEYARFRLERVAKGLFLPDEQIKNYVDWRQAETAEEKKFILKDAPDFYKYGQKHPGLDFQRIDLMKVPPKEFRDLNKEYKDIPKNGFTDEEWLINHPDYYKGWHLPSGGTPVSARNVRILTPLLNNPALKTKWQTWKDMSSEGTKKEEFVVAPENKGLYDYLVNSGQIERYSVKKEKALLNPDTADMERLKRQYDDIPTWDTETKQAFRRNNPAFNDWYIKEYGVKPLTPEHPLYGQYKKLPLGKARTDFRKKHPGLEKWGVDNKKWAPLAKSKGSSIKKLLGL